jgi:TPR repeat protein
LVGASLLSVLGCAPPQVAGPPLRATPTTEAFDTPKCESGRPPADPDLMAWDSTSRAALAAVRRQGVAVVRYEAHGCNVELELLSGCVAKGRYDFIPYWESKSKLASNATDLYAKLPIGAAGLAGQLQGNRSLRTDYMLAGLVQTPIGSSFQADDLVGDCGRATHLVTRIYLGGFAMAAGETRSLQASASLFSAGAGGKSDASLQEIERAGDASACELSHESQKEHANCAVPLRIGLLPLMQARVCTEPGECQSRCEALDNESCMILGFMYLVGKGVPRDANRGVGLFKQACDRGDDISCSQLGNLYAIGRDVPQDFVQAWSLFNQSCNKGIVAACGGLARLYEEGLGVAPDRERAAQLYATVCESGMDAQTCARRIPLLKAECDGGQGGDCFNLAMMYAKGQGTAVDYPTAAALLQQACDHGSEDGCTELGTVYVRGLGVDKDVAKGFGIYKTACDSGLVGSCAALGLAYVLGEATQKNAKLAATYLDRACSRGHSFSCGALGGLYEDGDGVKADLAKAVSLYTSSCDGGVPQACSSLASLYEQGKGLAQDAARALALYRQACDAGEQDSCRAVNRLAGTQ